MDLVWVLQMMGGYPMTGMPMGYPMGYPMMTAPTATYSMPMPFTMSAPITTMPAPAPTMVTINETKVLFFCLESCGFPKRVPETIHKATKESACNSY